LENGLFRESQLRAVFLIELHFGLFWRKHCAEYRRLSSRPARGTNSLMIGYFISGSDVIQIKGTTAFPTAKRPEKRIRVYRRDVAQN
jgi:hypothetical protein